MALLKNQARSVAIRAVFIFPWHSGHSSQISGSTVTPRSVSGAHVRG